MSLYCSASGSGTNLCRRKMSALAQLMTDTPRDIKTRLRTKELENKVGMDRSTAPGGCCCRCNSEKNINGGVAGGRWNHKWLVTLCVYVRQRRQEVRRRG